MLNNLLRNCIVKYNGSCRRKVIHNVAGFCNNIYKSDSSEETYSKQISTNDLMNHIVKLSDEINSLKQESHKVNEINTNLEQCIKEYQEFKVVAGKLIKCIEVWDSDKKYFEKKLKTFEDKIDMTIQSKSSKYSDENVNMNQNTMDQELEEIMNSSDKYLEKKALGVKRDAFANENGKHVMEIKSINKYFPDKEKQLLVLVKGLNRYVKHRENVVGLTLAFFDKCFGCKDMIDQVYLYCITNRRRIICVKLKDTKTKDYILETQHKNVKNPKIRIESIRERENYSNLEDIEDEQEYYKKLIEEIESGRDKY